MFNNVIQSSFSLQTSFIGGTWIFRKDCSEAVELYRFKCTENHSSSPIRLTPMNYMMGFRRPGCLVNP